MDNIVFLTDRISKCGRITHGIELKEPLSLDFSQSKNQGCEVDRNLGEGKQQSRASERFPMYFASNLEKIRCRMLRANGISAFGKLVSLALKINRDDFSVSVYYDGNRDWITVEVFPQGWKPSLKGRIVVEGPLPGTGETALHPRALKRAMLMLRAMAYAETDPDKKQKRQRKRVVKKDSFLNRNLKNCSRLCKSIHTYAGRRLGAYFYLRLVRQALILNRKDFHTFFDMTGHVNGIKVYAYPGGWRLGDTTLNIIYGRLPGTGLLAMPLRDMKEAALVLRSLARQSDLARRFGSTTTI